MDKIDYNLFSKIYNKFYRKDYFGEKQYLRKKIIWAKENNIQYTLSDIKKNLYGQKQKAYAMINERLIAYINGEHFPQSEKFTHAIFKAVKSGE